MDSLPSEFARQALDALSESISSSHAGMSITRRLGLASRLV